MHLKAPIILFPSFFVWVKEAVPKLGRKREVMWNTNTKKLLVSPKLVTKLYSWMETYENYYLYIDGSSIEIVNYDCGVASIFNAQGSLIKKILVQL